MKRTSFTLLFSLVVIYAQAQWGGGGHHHHHQPYNAPRCMPPRVVFAPPPPISFGCNYNRRPLINVVIAPRPRVVVAAPPPPPPPPQPQIIREWIEGHYEDGPNGRVWVEGHYIQREVY